MLLIIIETPNSVYEILHRITRFVNRLQHLNTPLVPLFPLVLKLIPVQPEPTDEKDDDWSVDAVWKIWQRLPR